MTYEKKFLKRLYSLGIEGIFKSFDMFFGVLSLAILLLVFDGHFPEESAGSILQIFATVSATLFALVLTGLTIITSFTDKLFLYAWQDVGEFENIVTTFQYNLFLPVAVLLVSLILLVQYDGMVMIALIALFVYMMFSLIDLVNLIVTYSLQRGEFVRQQIEQAVEDQAPDRPELSDTELVEIYYAVKESNNPDEREIE
jgi:hypothetical protein